MFSTRPLKLPSGMGPTCYMMRAIGSGLGKAGRTVPRVVRLRHVLTPLQDVLRALLGDRVWALMITTVAP